MSPIPGCMLSILVAFAVALPPPASSQETPDLPILRAHALDLVNEVRGENDLDQLDPGGDLDEAAQAHAEDMLQRDYYAHASPEGKTVRDRYLDAGGSEWELVAENIARCTGCPWPPKIARIEELHQGWMESPGHRANILREGLSRFGFGIAGEEDGALYAVQTFAGPGVPGGDDHPDGAEPIAEADVVTLALSGLNEARRDVGVPDLAASGTLTSAAQNLVPADLAGFSIEELGDVFAALPNDKPDEWSRIATVAGTCGGCGTQVTRGDVEAHIADWLADEGYRQTLLNPEMSHLGFVVRADGEGRKVSLALLGKER
jgi:uncharacterized protein YkwD